jgi:hypothetical protein
MKERILQPELKLNANMDSYFEEKSGSMIKGEIFWTLRDGESGEIQDRGHIKNVVTIDASILIARLLKSPGVANVSEPKFGVYALAVGTGNVGWDPMNPPAGTSTQRSLYNEIGRKTIATSNYINSLGAISAIPTNVVDYTVTFTESEAVGPLVEMGLIGGDPDSNVLIRNPILPANGLHDPTVDVRSLDMLLNYTTFKVINKPPTSTWSLTWRLST